MKETAIKASLVSYLLIPKMAFFRPKMKNNDVIAENHFQTPVAYPKGEEGAGAPYEVAPMGPTKNEH